MATPSKPDCLTEDMLEYLDELRESGITNMYGAGSFVADEFDLSRKDASAVLSYWMQTFGERHNKEN